MASSDKPPPAYSTTKGMVALCASLLIDQRLLNVDAMRSMPRWMRRTESTDAGPPDSYMRNGNP